MQDSTVDAIVACRLEQDPPDAFLIEGVHVLCTDLLYPNKNEPWTPDGQRVSLANLGGLWLTGDDFRLAITQQPRWSSAVHKRGFAWNPAFRDAFAKRLWSRASQAFSFKACRAANIPAPHVAPKVTVLPPCRRIKLVGLPLELANRGTAPVIASPPEKAPPPIPRQTYFLLNIAVSAGELSGWHGTFRTQEEYPVSSFMDSWHRSLGAPDPGQAAPPIRAWSRWARFKQVSQEPGVRETNLYAPSSNAVAAFRASVAKGGTTAAAAVH